MSVGRIPPGLQAYRNQLGETQPAKTSDLPEELAQEMAAELPDEDGPMETQETEDGSLLAELIRIRAEVSRQVDDPMREVNEQIEAARKSLEPLMVKPVPVPSALGLNLDGASSKLGRSDLRVAKVQQEYHDHIPEGHVIVQVPSPGARIGKGSGVSLVISKGPPPESQKTDKDREDVAVLRFKDKDKQEKELEMPELNVTEAPTIIV